MQSNSDTFLTDQNLRNYDKSLAYQYPDFESPDVLPSLPFSPCKRHVMRGMDGYQFDYSVAPIADLDYVSPIIPYAPGIPGPNLKPFHEIRGVIIEEIIPHQSSSSMSNIIYFFIILLLVIIIIVCVKNLPCVKECKSKSLEYQSI